jgi:hypothetical protein
MPTLSKACARRDGRADASAYGSWCWFGSAADDVNIRWTCEIGLENDEGSDRIKAAYGGNYERLVGLKNKYDPTNLFRHNQNIKPTV